MGELLSTTTATTLVPTEQCRTWTEVSGLLDQLWPGATEVLDSCHARLLVHSVGEDCSDGGWLTWRLEAVGAQATRVELQLDELASGAPEPELDQVLLALLSRCVPTFAE